MYAFKMDILDFKVLKNEIYFRRTALIVLARLVPNHQQNDAGAYCIV